MPSAFDQIFSNSSNCILNIFGKKVDIDGVKGVAVIRPDSSMEMGGGVHLINGARITFRASDFPDIAVNSEIVLEGADYIVTHLYDIEFSAMRQADIALA